MDFSENESVLKDKFINKEIEPGPAKSGIAKGLKEISSLIIDSFFTSP